MKNFNNLISQLENINSKADQEIIKNGIAKLFEEMGYLAIAEEIRNNRKAKSNALYGIKMYYRDIVSDRINPVTNDVFPASEELKEKASAFNMAMTKLINKYLTDGNDKQ